MYPAVIRRGFHSRWPQRREEEGEVLFFFVVNETKQTIVLANARG